MRKALTIIAAAAIATAILPATAFAQRDDSMTTGSMNKESMSGMKSMKKTKMHRSLTRHRMHHGMMIKKPMNGM